MRGKSLLWCGRDLSMRGRGEACREDGNLGILPCCQHLPAFIAQISLHSCDLFVASRCCPFDNVSVPGETQLSRTRLITRQVYVAGEHPAGCGMTSTSAGVFSQRAATLGICCPRK